MKNPPFSSETSEVTLYSRRVCVCINVKTYIISNIKLYYCKLYQAILSYIILYYITQKYTLLNYILFHHINCCLFHDITVFWNISYYTIFNDIVLNQIKLNYSVFSCMFKYHIKRTILYITLCLIVCIMLNMYTLNFATW